MALMYPWATKEYLLWNMSVGQILLYYNKGIEIKNGTEKPTGALSNMSASELRKFRDDAYKAVEGEKKDEIGKTQHEAMTRKYGAIDG